MAVHYGPVNGSTLVVYSVLLLFIAIYYILVNNCRQIFRRNRLTDANLLMRFKASLSCKPKRSFEAKMNILKFLHFYLIFQLSKAGDQKEAPDQSVSRAFAYRDHCQDGWTYFRGSCYLFVDNMNVDWTEAVHHCSLHHGELATVQTEAEDLFIQNMAKRLYKNLSDRNNDENYSSFWLGASDSTVEGLWTWYTDGSNLIYINWTPGQPDSYKGVDEDCLGLFGPHNYTWDDVSCTAHKYHPLCEIE